MTDFNEMFSFDFFDRVMSSL